MQSLQTLPKLPTFMVVLSPIADILKNTREPNPDRAELEKALTAIKEVMTHINEDKRKTEGRIALFDIFNDIEKCPVSLTMLFVRVRVVRDPLFSA